MRKNSIFVVVVIFVSFTLVADAGVQKLGVMTDIHWGNADDVGYVTPRDGIPKVREAITQFKADNCDLIIHLGDYIHSSLIDMAIIDQMNITWDDGNDSIPRAFVLGNHDMESGYATKAEYFAVATAEQSNLVSEQLTAGASGLYYFSFNTGNLHHVVLDSQFGADGTPYGDPCFTGNEIGDQTVPPEQLAWLDNDLATADAAGKKSIIYTHQSIGSGGITAIQNNTEVQNILKGHSVILCVSGHRHESWRGYIPGTNKDGFRIRQIIADGLANWNLEDDPNNNFIELHVDGVSGMHAIVGYGGETSDELDYGDSLDPTYPTFLASDGARHTVDGVAYLGSTVDTELNGQPRPLALGDDNDGNDDEDGVTFTSLIIPGDPCATVNVTASTTGLLNAWLDFNADGDWDDAVDQIFTNQLLNAGLNNLTFPVPALASPGVTYGRFRFDTYGGLSYTGPACDGEVEDYTVVIGEQGCEAVFDFDNDGDIDLSDLSTFVECWLNENPICCLADYDTNGNVDLKDFASFRINLVQ